MLSDELVKKLKDFPGFTEFSQFVLSKIEELDTLSGLEKMPNKRAGEEAKVRAKAKEKLYEILAPFVDFRVKKGPTKEEVEKARKKVGL